jgi:preprotein translocase subunit SecE
MSARAENGTSPLDTAKLVLAVAVFAAGVVGFYYFEDQSTLYRVLGMVAVAAAAIGIAATTEPGRAAIGFAREARQEVRKVVWPTRQETLQTTLIVLVLVVLVAVLLWLLDMFFLWGVEKLISPGG